VLVSHKNAVEVHARIYRKQLQGGSGAVQ
jgi:hypothetical protein